MICFTLRRSRTIIKEQTDTFDFHQRPSYELSVHACCKVFPLLTSRRSSIALKRRRYTNAGDTTVSEWSRGKRGIEKTNIETLPSTFHFQENGPMYRLNYIFPGPPPLLLPVCRQRTPCPSSRAHTYACTQSGIPLSREKGKSERDGQ